MKLKFRRRHYILALLSISFIPVKSDAQQTHEKKSQQAVLPLDTSVRKGKLANGFTYYIRHNEEPKNRVIMYLVNKAGSILENEDQRGLAHFMEHMSFNGTTHFPHNELVNYLQNAGVRFGADINAYTSFDETVYQLPLPADRVGLVDTGLQIMRDWAHNATLDPTEIDKERGVVLEEKRLGKGAKERMSRQYFPILLNNSRYAERIPIGLDTVLDNFKRPLIAEFYNDWYRPDLQALIVVGDIDVNEMEKKIIKEFSDLENPVHEKPRPAYTIPLDGKNHFIEVTDKEMASTVAEVIIKHTEQPFKTASDYKNDVIKDLYNQMLGERYERLSRSAKSPFLEGSAGISDFMGGLNQFGVDVSAKPGELESGFKAAWREVQRVKQFGFTQGELDRAKANYLSGMEAAWKEKSKTNSKAFVQEYQDNFLKGIPSPGIDMEYKMVKADLPEITLADMNALTTANITDINRDILILAPDKDKSSLPGEPMVKAWMKAVEAEKLEPYKDDVSAKPLLANEPVPGKIVAEKKDSATSTITYSLSNGVQVILKPTDFKNGQVMFNGSRPGGASLASDANYQSAALSAQLVSASGVGNFNETELENFLSGKQANVHPYLGSRSEGLQGSATTKDLETAFSLIYAYITEPRKGQESFGRIITNSKANLANRSNDPNSVFSDTIEAVLYNNNSRLTGPSMAKINQINIDSAYEFYKQRFGSAAGMTFTFVGSIDTVAMKPLLEKYIASLPALEKAEEPVDLGIHIQEGIINKNVYKGTEPKSTVLLIFSGKLDYNEQNNVRLDALKETLEIRLLERLREDESGVYSPGVSENTTKYPEGRYSFMIKFGCAPQNVDKLVASTMDEINKLKMEGPTEQNLKKWLAEDKAAMETQLKTNGFWLAYLSGQVENKEPLGQLNGYNNLTEALSVEDVKAAANDYLGGSNFIKLVLLPETISK